MITLGWFSRSILSGSLQPYGLCSPPGTCVHGISQVKILEWVAISFSKWSSQPRDQTHLCCIAGEFFTTEPAGKPTIVLNLHKYCSRPAHDRVKKKNVILQHLDPAPWKRRLQESDVKWILFSSSCQLNIMSCFSFIPVWTITFLL